jgi:hypothetical protein
MALRILQFAELYLESIRTVGAKRFEDDYDSLAPPLPQPGRIMDRAVEMVANFV